MNQYMQEVAHFGATSPQFLYQVYLPVMLWLLVILGTFVFLLKKYTFGNWSVENPNPNSGETFAMPRGTFRGMLTLTLLFVTVVFELANVHIIGFEEEMHEFMIAFQMMLAFYFGSKVMHHVTSTDRKKAQVLADAQTGGTTNGDFSTQQGDEDMSVG